MHQPTFSILLTSVRVKKGAGWCHIPFHGCINICLMKIKPSVKVPRKSNKMDNLFQEIINLESLISNSTETKQIKDYR